MVSFQCDGNCCSDVVKKPKLDQHRIRCKSSFTCIDCSKTFSTPADWKGHTSCISEAEKYQKSLYKPKNNHDRARNTNVQGRNGKFNNGNNWNKGIPRSQATGANGTPLGTPVRMSPVMTTENEAIPSTPSSDSKRVETSISPSGQKRKAVEMSSDNPSDGVKEEIKSSKKRKSDAKEVHHAKTGGADADASREINPEDKAGAGKKKKDKKVDEINGKNEGDLNATVEKDTKVKQKKEKKHKKNEVPREEGTAEIDDAAAQAEDKDEKVNVTIEKSEKKKKSKRSKKDDLKEGGGDENARPSDASSVKKEERKKKKTSKDNQDGIENGDIHTEKEGPKLDESSAAKTDKEKIKKSKKRKHAGNDEETSEKVEPAAEKKRKKD